MKPKVRRILFGVGGAALAAILVAAVVVLPGFGHYPGPYGDVVNAISVPLRHATDAVSAVNFDIRGIDTLGEEFILVLAVTGTSVVIRNTDSKRRSTGLVQRGPTTDGTRLAIMASGCGLMVLGVDVATHGQISPGGGFQGGVLLATAVVMVIVAGKSQRFRSWKPMARGESLESFGSGVFAAVGLATALATGAFLANALPLGTAGGLASAGTILLLSIGTAIEVCGAFVILVAESLDHKPLAPEG